jgi:hypothetical protein
VAVIVVAAVVVRVYMNHPRNEAAFIGYVHKYANFDGRKLTNPPERAVLLDAGDRACDWLGDQSWALWRNDPERTVSGLLVRHESAMPRQDRTLPDSVSVGAWAFLCPATRTLVQPHRPFSRAGD